MTATLHHLPAPTHPLDRMDEQRVTLAQETHLLAVLHDLITGMCGRDAIAQIELARQYADATRTRIRALRAEMDGELELDCLCSRVDGECCLRCMDTDEEAEVLW